MKPPLAWWIKQAILEHGWPDREVDRRCGWPVGTTWRLLNRHVLTPKRALALQTVLGLDASEMLRYQGRQLLHRVASASEELHVEDLLHRARRRGI